MSAVKTVGYKATMTSNLTGLSASDELVKYLILIDIGITPSNRGS